MSDAFSTTRRRVLGLLAGLLGAWPAIGAPDAPGDRGIGGTGARPTEDEMPEGGLGGDRGIGGTGVIGTIRRFGSIVVNDLRIAYPRDAVVQIDGAPARISDLKIGHVVHVVAQGAEGALSTRRIDVTSEVVGPVEAAGKGRLTVLGQSVTTAGAHGSRSVAVGQQVAVYGLRRPDGTIVASLIEPRQDGAAQVAGPVRKGADGVPRIGGLRFEGLNAGLVGRRAVVEGRPAGGGLAVSTARDASRPFGAGVARASIEGYVAREGVILRFGSGLRVASGPAVAPPRGGALAVVTTGVGRDGRLTADAVRVEGRGGASGPGQTPGPGGGRGPGQGGGPGRSESPGGSARPSPGGSSREGPGRGGVPSGERVTPGRDGGAPGRDGYRIDTRPGPGGPAGEPGFGGRGGSLNDPGGPPGGGLGSGPSGPPGGGPSFGGGGPGFGGGGFGGGGFGGGRGGR